MQINGDSFLDAFKNNRPQWTEFDGKTGDQVWSDIMFRWLHETGRELSLGMCCEKMAAPEEAGSWKMGLRKEFLFDVTYFHKDDWKNSWVQPAVILEHENRHHQDAFLDDLWKVLLGSAPVRVMFGYSRKQDDAKEYIQTINQSSSAWRFPAKSDDLILLGHYDMEEFLVYRRTGRKWKPDRKHPRIGLRNR